ncbi:MAG: hypothetical protein F7B17_00605 [Desulfurococcales archaeon]|nr:hypothetical protein [Desulfurococcales archaeon]
MEGWFIEITVYRGVDVDGIIAERVARMASLVVATAYGIPVDVNVVEIPADSVESREKGLPVVIVNGEVVSEGRVPAVSDLVDAIFHVIGSRAGVPMAYGFPLVSEEAVIA